MNRFELRSFATAEELAQAAAKVWLEEVAQAEARGTPYLVALSGGRIAGRFLAVAAAQAARQGAALRSVQFFWSDERCVPPADPESNFGLARRQLLLPLAIPDPQLHRLRGEDPPEAAAAQAQAELCRLAPRRPDGQPVLDLVFLGVGEEGHVASLFPGEPEELAASAAVFRPVTAPKPPPRRITLGYPAIAAARRVWVLASGPGKEGALRASLAPTGRTPLARVLQMRRETTIFTDLVPPNP